MFNSTRHSIITVLLILVALPLLSCGGGGGLDILLITLDTTRADHLHCYGNLSIDTPQLDRLAREGILFENAIAQVPVTLPSHSSIMTGLTPMAHGVRDNGTYQLSENAVTLAEVLRDRGYVTAAFIGAFVLHSTFGLAQGFDFYDEDLSQGRSQSEFHFVERTADQVTDAALDWLEHQNRRRPLFMWVHYFDPHLNYDAPSPFRERYATAPYDGEIAFTDRQLGRLFSYLEEKGLWERTMIVVVGDHGESLGEHGERSHSLTVYESALHVPYILSHPEGRKTEHSARWRPRRIETQVETIDLFPTLVELTGDPPAHQVEGRSLLPLLDGEPWHERAAYAETIVPYLLHRWAPLRTVRYDGLKYIRAPRAELYDLENDPHELKNLVEERPEDLARLGEELQLLVERAREVSVGAEEVTLPQADRERLASLGYLQSGRGALQLEELDPSELDRPDPKDVVWAASQYLMAGMDPLTHDEPEEAERLFRLFLKADPTSSEGYFHLGLALRAQGKMEEALEAFAEAARLNPQNHKPFLHLAITNVWMQRGEEAMRWAERARELNPYSGEPLIVIGNILEYEDRLEEALAYFDEAIKLDEGNPTFHLARGTVLQKMGREEEGLAEIKMAVDSTPHAEFALLGLAKVLGERGLAELALPLFSELVRIDPTEPLYQSNLGNCYLLTGDSKRAVEQFRQALRLAPDVAQYHYMLGCAFANLKDYPQARACWERTIELDPGHEEARHNLELLEGGNAP